MCRVSLIVLLLTLTRYNMVFMSPVFPILHIVLTVNSWSQTCFRTIACSLDLKCLWSLQQNTTTSYQYLKTRQFYTLHHPKRGRGLVFLWHKYVRQFMWRHFWMTPNVTNLDVNSSIISDFSEEANVFSRQNSFWQNVFLTKFDPVGTLAAYWVLFQSFKEFLEERKWHIWVDS